MGKTNPYCLWLFWLIGVLILFMPSIASLSHAITPEEFLASTAARAFKDEDYGEALKGFEDLLKKYPGDDLILRYIAITYDRLERYPEAVATYQKTLAIAPQNPALHLFLGITYFKMREGDKAREAFKKSIALAPDSLYAERAQQYIDVMGQQEAQYEQPGAPKAWDLYLHLGIQYDDNVPAAPGGTGLFVGDRDGLRGTQYLKGWYRFLQNKTWGLKSEVSAYQSEHTGEDINNFDLSSFEVTLDLSYAATLRERPFVPGLRYSYKPVLLQGDTFSRSHIVTASINTNPSGRTTTTLFYRLTFDNFSEEGFDKSISSRDAMNNAIGLTQYLYFAQRRGYVSAGYQYQFNDAEGLNFNFRGHQGGVGLSVPLPLGIRMDQSAEYSREDYPDFQADEDRRTNRFTYLAALSRSLWDRLSASLSYYYTKEDSNFIVLEYKRQVATLAMAYIF